MSKSLLSLTALTIGFILGSATSVGASEKSTVEKKEMGATKADTKEMKAGEKKTEQIEKVRGEKELRELEKEIMRESKGKEAPAEKKGPVGTPAKRPGGCPEGPPCP